MVYAPFSKAIISGFCTTCARPDQGTPFALPLAFQNFQKFSPAAIKEMPPF